MPKLQTASLRFILTAEAAAAFDDITRDGRVNQLSDRILEIGLTHSALLALFPRSNTCEPTGTHAANTRWKN